MYTVGSTYTRKDVYDILSLPEAQRGGDWLNGYHRHGSEYYIFCNVGVPGRTGHDYENYWEGETLVWHGKNGSHFGQESIKNIISDSYLVRIFYRESDRAPFTYAGIGKAIPYESTARPVRVDWVFGTEQSTDAPFFTDELSPEANYSEGQRTQVLVNRYERDRGARDACVQHHGATCWICSFDFQKKYGAIGQGFIHVHHLVPLSEQGEKYKVDPVKDLIPVCPNCHAMLHRKTPPFTPEELAKMLAERA